MNQLRLSRHTRIIVFLTVIVLATSVTVAYAAYRINRPVALGDEPILQTRLYGEQADVHQGVDFSAGVDFGDSVYAVAAGRVVQVEAGRANNCHPWEPPPLNCPDWGNYVLIQHNDQCLKSRGIKIERQEHLLPY